MTMMKTNSLHLFVVVFEDITQKRRVGFFVTCAMSMCALCVYQVILVLSKTLIVKKCMARINLIVYTCADENNTCVDKSILKACAAIFYQIFIVSPNDSPLKIMKCFSVHLKIPFCS